MAPHCSTLAWKIPWVKEPGRLQSMGSRRVGHDWATSLFTFTHWRRKWQPTPVLLPGESQGQGSLVGCHLWGRTVGHDWSDLVAAAASADVFLELSCFFNDPVDVGNLISGSSALSKSNLNIWKFMDHVLLKPGLENFEHYFTDRMWSTGKGNGNSLQYSCLENPWTVGKGKMIGYWKKELPRSLGAQYATGDQWRNYSRKNEWMKRKQKQYPLWMWLVIEARSDAVKSNIA